MTTKKIATALISLATGASLLSAMAFVPSSVSAAGGLNATTTVKARANANANSDTDADGANRLPKIIERSDAAITARIAKLNALNGRVQAIKNVSADEKSHISDEVQTNISGLTSLKAKIDADTDVTVALTDEKSIYGSFRIYALIVPQGYIMASSDRIDTIVGMMNTISAKLQTRITADQSAGKDVTALQNSLDDLKSKIGDAKSQGDNAQSEVASLTPDGGDKTKLASNTAALKDARAKIKVGTGDLQTARQDAKSIIQGLKELEGNASVKASASVKANQ